MLLPSAAVLVLLLQAKSLASPLAPRELVVTITGASADPDETNQWAAGATVDYPIHSSCNSTQRIQLRRALNDAVKLAEHARDHLLRWGNSSSLVTKYFGNASTAEPIGWYDRVVNADKGGIWFRCDDPDKNCATQQGWAGHWRGSNATLETVICPLSFTARWPLEALCSRGYTVAQSPLNTIWAVDLLHRIFHVPKISENVVDHYAEDYADVLSLAKGGSGLGTKDSDTLQYFAIEVYAFDIAVLGKGCPGEVQAHLPAETVTASASINNAAPSATTSASTSCHTHSDGAVHCV